MAEAGKSKVLIVDDEDVVREFLERFFVQKGMEVALAESGERAMELARREKFDLAFLDVRMPKLNGLETLKELKVISPDTTYVMMTGYAVDDLLREAERHGAASSIKKPFDINKLSTLLDGFDLRKADRKEMGILVVDDDNIVAGFFKGLLHEYNIVTAASGREALDRLEERDFDLIFLDIGLRDISGIELCKRIKQARPETEIILITGDPMRGEQAKNLGIRGCFWKPFEIDKILSEVSSVKKQKGRR